MGESLEDTVFPKRQPPKRLVLSRSRLTGQIFRLAIPAVAENFLVALMMLVDVVMVGQYCGDVGVTSVGFGGLLALVMMVLFLPVSIATNALIARYVGARDMEKARHTTAQSMMIVVALGAVVSVALVVYAPDVIGMMNIGSQDAEIFKYAVIYVRWLFASFIFRLMFLNAGAAIKGAGNTITPAMVGLVVNVLNIVLDYALIFGRLGMPELGIAGAGIATAVSSLVGGTLMAASLFTRFSVIHMSPAHLKRWSWKIFGPLMRIALPGVGEQILMQTGMVLFFRIVTQMGDTATGAFIIGMRVEMLSLLPGFGFGIACSTLVGQGLGAGKPEFARLSMIRSAVFGCLLMAGLGLLIFFFRETLPLVFNPSEDVLALTAKCLVIVAFTQVPIAIAMVLIGGLKGAGDTMSVMLVALVGVMVVRVPLAYYLSLECGFGLVGVWWAGVIDWIVRLGIVIILVWRGRWSRLKV